MDKLNPNHSPRTLITITILILALSVSCFPKKGLLDNRTVILPLGDTINLTDGSIVYSLPRTVFDVEVDCELRIEKPGPYAKFAGDLLGLKDVISQEKEAWSVTGLKVYSSEDLDPSEFYLIRSNSLFQTNVLALRKSGLILDLNPDIYDRSNNRGINKTSSDFQQGFMDMGASEYFVNQNDTAFKLVKLDTSFIKIPYLVEKKKLLSIDQLAEKAAKSLLEIRDGKHLILTGEANVFPQGKSAIDEMNRLEREYLALFAGKVRTEVHKFFYTLVPEKKMSGKPIALFRFSPQAGPTDTDGNTGTPVTVEMIPFQKTKEITVIAKQSPEKTVAPEYDKLYYRIPEVVTVNIKMGEEKLYISRKLIYQFGKIVQLPANYIIGK